MRHIMPFLIPLFGIVFGAMVLIARSPIGQAIGRRISGERGVPDEVHQHLLEVQAEMELLRAELAETQERLDFAERLLLKGAEGAPDSRAPGS